MPLPREPHVSSDLPRRQRRLLISRWNKKKGTRTKQMRKRLMYSKHLIYIERRHDISWTRCVYKTELRQACSIPAPLAYLNYALREN